MKRNIPLFRRKTELERQQFREEIIREINEVEVVASSIDKKIDENIQKTSQFVGIIKSVTVSLKKAGKAFAWALKIFSFCVLVLGVIAFIYDRKEYSHARSMQSWQVLTSKIPGDSGKSEALKYLGNWDCMGLENYRWFLDFIYKSRINPNTKSDMETPVFDIVLAQIKQLTCLKDPSNFKYLDLSQEDKTRLTVEQFYPKFISFQSAKFKNTTFETSTFWRTNFNNALFRNVHIKDSKFIAGYLAHSKFYHSDFFRVSFEAIHPDSTPEVEGKDLMFDSTRRNKQQAAYVYPVHMIDTEFNSSNLMATSFKGVVLPFARFDSSFLNGVSFFETNLSEASFNKSKIVVDIAKLDNFINSDVSRADFRNTVWIVKNSQWFKDGTREYVTNDSKVVESVCAMFQKARNWEQAYRAEKYECGAEIPEYPDKS